MTGRPLDAAPSPPTVAADLSCQSLVELVTEYLESALPPEQRLACEAHVAGCPGCDAYLRQMRQTILALGRLVDEALDPATRATLLGQFRSILGHAV